MQICWNTFSRKQTKRLVRLIDLLLVYLAVEDPVIQVNTASVFKSAKSACQSQLLT